MYRKQFKDAELSAEAMHRLHIYAPELLQALKELRDATRQYLNTKKDFHLSNIHACAGNVVYEIEHGEET